ncbi:unnamed protein product [Polarella glacialis]|uniref:Uncharacterized protein n=1 Tax=Polarella glacialis TaxID=89957 RepID=A0A813DE87_POLGL|nr:unnamed protein product [Polarella glacialis]CAE8742734.1 unnamed protein product [Polarella glacialis]
MTGSRTYSSGALNPGFEKLFFDLKAFVSEKVSALGAASAPELEPEVEVSPGEQAEASRVISRFCEEYPATRIAPNLDELSHCWSQCASLAPTAVSEAIHEQLGWASGGTDWQPRLRTLLLLEYMRRQEGTACEVVNGVLTESAELLHYMAAELPQCRAAAYRLLNPPAVQSGVDVATRDMDVECAMAEARLSAQAAQAQDVMNFVEATHQIRQAQADCPDCEPDTPATTATARTATSTAERSEESPWGGPEEALESNVGSSIGSPSAAVEEPLRNSSPEPQLELEPQVLELALGTPAFASAWTASSGLEEESFPGWTASSGLEAESSQSKSEGAESQNDAVSPETTLTLGSEVEKKAETSGEAITESPQQSSSPLKYLWLSAVETVSMEALKDPFASVKTHL